jgi:hypothetical protein
MLQKTRSAIETPAVASDFQYAGYVFRENEYY